MSYDNVEARGSDLKRGAAGQAIIFAAYLISLTILAILQVHIAYFVVIAVVGLPATGIIQAAEAHVRQKRWEKEFAEQQKLEEPIRVQRATTPDGLPMIEL